MTAKKKRGRPFRKLSAEQERTLQGLCQIGCTNDEISAMLGVSWNTLDRNYGEVIKKGRAAARVSLRRMQWKLANDGNVAMAIWLGKQAEDRCGLGQREPPHEITPPADGAAFKVEVIRRVIVDAAGHPDR